MLASVYVGQIYFLQISELASIHLVCIFDMLTAHLVLGLQ